MTYQNPATLVQRAEAAAEKLMDPAQFDFLATLEAPGGIKMPKDKVIVFLNADVSSQMIKLQQEHDELMSRLTASDTVATEDLVGVEFTRLMGEQDEARAAYDKEFRRIAKLRKDSADDDMLSSIADEPEDLPPLPVAPAWHSVAEIQALAVANVIPVRSPVPERAQAIVAEIEALVPKAWAARYEISIEGIQPTEQIEYEDQIEAEMHMPLQAGMTPEQKVEYAGQRRSNELVSRSITAVYDPQKDVTTDFSETRMPPGAARRLCRPLPHTETRKLIMACQVLTMAATMVDLQSDAGFPGGRVESEGEPALFAGDPDGEELG